VCVTFNTFFSFCTSIQILQCVFLILHVFSVFLTIFQVIQCLCLIFHVFRFSRHNLGPTVCISNFSRFSLFLTIFQVLQCVFLILHVFPCFSPYYRSYHDFIIFLVCQFSRPIKVLECVFLIFHVFQFSRHITGPNVFISHFSRFSVFLAIFQVIQCLCLIFHIFQFFRQNPGPIVFLIIQVFHRFSPYSRSYSVCFSFCTFFSVSCHSSCPNM